MGWLCRTKYSDCDLIDTTRYRWAFSLVELMVVVAIIGILVSLALPRYKTFVAKGRMAEAIHNLGVIKSLHKSYTLKYQMFGQDDVVYNGLLMGNGTSNNHCGQPHLKNKLGFRVEDCTNLRYDYLAHRGNIQGLVVAAINLPTPNVSILQAAINASSSYATAVNNGVGTHKIYPGCTGSGDGWLLTTGAAVGTLSGSVSGIQHPLDIIEQCE